MSQSVFRLHAESRILHFDADRWARSMVIPGASGDVREEARWREAIDAVPALVYLLASKRQEGYVIGSASNRQAIAAIQGRLVCKQPQHDCRQWPSLVWLQMMPSRARADSRVRDLKCWPHNWQRRLVERSNPDWIDLDDLLFHRPLQSRQPVAENSPAPCQTDGSAQQAATEAARLEIAALPAQQDWTGAAASWWYAQVKAAPWLVSVFACSRQHAFRIESRPGRVLEATLASLFTLNRARKLAGAKLPSWRWVLLEPFVSEAEALERQQELQQWPQPWIQRLVSDRNPDWHALETLLAGWQPDTLATLRIPAS